MRKRTGAQYRFFGQLAPEREWPVSGRAYPRAFYAWQLIEQYPGMTFRELAVRMGCCLSVAYFHCRRLRAWGVIPDDGARARTLVARIPYRAQSFLSEAERAI